MRAPWARFEPVDLVVALALTLATQAEIWAPDLLGADTGLTERPLLSVTSLAITLPLVLRRTMPWLVAVVALGFEVLQSLLATPADGLANLLAMLVTVYSLGRYARRPTGYAGGVLVATAALGLGEDGADKAFVLLVLGAAWAAGVLVGRRTDDLGALELRRLAATREGAEEERLRIARELHDVVAHRVSLIVVQSQLADTLLDRDPEGARAAIRAVEDAGRDALTELRSVLGLLHDEGGEAARSPGDAELARLAGIVDAARASGLPASYDVSGEARPVPPAVALAAFRIVQESLTNVVRHAGGAPTRVRLAYETGRIAVTVEDEGPRVSSHEPGHGLAGMAERASFVGGTLQAGPREGSGFRVAATLPTPEAAT